MKIFTKSAALSTALVLGLATVSLAQTPLDGFMQGKGGGNITLSVTSEHYKNVYLYPQEIDATPVFDAVTTNSFNIYGNYGLSDKLDVIFNVPFVQSSGDGDPVVLQRLGYSNEQSGAQDLSAFLKYEIAKKGNVSFLGSLGVTTPLSDYANSPTSLQSIIAIGNRSTTYNAVLIGHYKDSRGFFITAQAGYSLRTTDVPDAVLSELKIGFAVNRFYIAAQVGNQTSTGGVDILRSGFTGSFPATKVNYTKVGGTIYTPIDGNLGISVSGGGLVDGRNVGKSYYGSAGLTYNFKYRAL
ncbi:hypothetical protein I5M32_14265 [Pedobacter sp. SD-b]|uniref:MetA-pathway of phenol degradation n=1 Tax=Pedobacter segetis TaxID=2793069 RepID=A0ABS1BMM5_9SPHI|nr:hypothetical protein [Pedobacter segetis]MBK0384130.1 hypothetical protein [Pedobacter segetis]